MKRREILRYTAYITGAAISAPLASTVLSGCKTKTASGGVAKGLHFFSTSDFDLITRLVDTILPKTDSPSASEVGVHHTIDTMVGKVYPPEYRESYKTGFVALTEYLGKSADLLSAIQLLEKAEETSLSDARKAYLNIKQQTVAYFLSTEEIGTNYLNYLPVPGEYKSCISLDEVDGKAWAI